MFPTNNPKWQFASAALQDAYIDFILSRQAMNCSIATLDFYKYTAGRFLIWAEQHGVTSPQEVTARIVREHLTMLAADGKKDTTVHDHARAIRTLLRYWHSESYIPEPVKFEMPKVAQRRLPVLTADQLKQIIKLCSVREKAIVLFMVDSGLRKSEVTHLNWGDVNMMNGLVMVKRGKGKKDRSAVVGTTARRALLKYRRTLQNTADDAPLFQTQAGTRFHSDGFQQIFRRLSERTGIYFTAHALRRTFTILSLRSCMDV